MTDQERVRFIDEWTNQKPTAEDIAEVAFEIGDDSEARTPREFVPFLKPRVPRKRRTRRNRGRNRR